MREFHGFDELLKAYKELGVWWIFTKRGFINNSKEDISTGAFYVPENDDEEEESYTALQNWLETQTFEDIITNKLEHNPKSSRDDFIEAAIYYLEQDDFLD